MADSNVPKNSNFPAPSSGPGASTPLRLMLIADQEALRCYGPVLKRLSVGLLDEVSDLSLLSLGPSRLLSYVPSPPVRLITETRFHQSAPRYDITARQATIAAGQFALFDKLWPHRRLARLVKGIRPYKPTLVHAISERQIPLAQGISKQLGINYVVSLLSMGENGQVFSDPRCGAVLCCSSSLAREIRRHQPELAYRIHVLSIGTHVSDEPCCFRRPRKCPIIFCCSPFDDNYGLPNLINAVKRLATLGHQPLLILSGSGPAESVLQQQVTKLDLLEQIHFVPPVDAMLSVSDAYKLILREADIFVQPWPARSWRPELLEAMSVGSAVVVADGADGHNNDLIIDDQTALTVPFRDEQALTDTLARLLSNHDAARSLARGAQQHLRKHFLASRMISRLARAYHQALKV